MSGKISVLRLSVREFTNHSRIWHNQWNFGAFNFIRIWAENFEVQLKYFVYNAFWMDPRCTSRKIEQQQQFVNFPTENWKHWNIQYYYILPAKCTLLKIIYAKYEVECISSAQWAHTKGCQVDWIAAKQWTLRYILNIRTAFFLRKEMTFSVLLMIVTPLLSGSWFHIQLNLSLEPSDSYPVRDKFSVSQKLTG